MGKRLFKIMGAFALLITVYSCASNPIQPSCPNRPITKINSFKTVGTDQFIDHDFKINYPGSLSRMAQAGVNIYQVGDYLGVDIPNSSLFITDTADLLPNAPLLLKQIMTLLQHNSQNCWLIVSHTGGFDRHKRENELSIQRAKHIANLLEKQRHDTCSLSPTAPTDRIEYIGYANRLPIANTFHFSGISANEHTQITAYFCSVNNPALLK